MNNKTVIAVVVVVIVLVAGFFMFKGKSAPTNAPADNSSVATNPEAPKQNSLKGLLTLGTSQQCTFNDTVSNNSGTVYVSSGQMRGDFSAQVNGKTEASHMISDGQTSYVWMDGTSTGFKMKFDASTQGNTQSQGVDANKNMDFNCSSWIADASLFIVPAPVKFTDTTALTPSGSGTSDSSQSSQAAACASLSEPAKTQCLQSIQ